MKKKKKNREGLLGIPPDDKEEDSIKKKYDVHNKKNKSLESALFLSKSGDAIKMKSLS